MKHGKLYRYLFSSLAVLSLWQSNVIRAEFRFFKINPNRYSTKDFNSDFDAEWQTGLPLIVHYGAGGESTEHSPSVFAHQDDYSIPPKDCPPEIIQAIQRDKCTNIRYYVAFTQPKNSACNLFPHLVFLPRMEWLNHGKNISDNVFMGVYRAVNLGKISGPGGLPFGGIANFAISYHDWNMLSGNIGRFQIVDPKNLAEGWFLMRQREIAVVVHWYFFPPQWAPNAGTRDISQGYEQLRYRAVLPILIEPQIMPQKFGENTLQCLNKPWAELPIHAQQSIRTELMAWLEGNFIDGLGEEGFVDRLQEAFPEPFMTWILNNLDILPNLLRFSFFHTFSYFLNGLPEKLRNPFLGRLPNYDKDPTLIRELCCIFPKRFVQFLLNHPQDTGLYANPNFQRDVASVGEFLRGKDSDILQMNKNDLCSLLSSKTKSPKNFQAWLSGNIELLLGWHLNPQPAQRSATQPRRMAVSIQSNILNSTDFLALLKNFSALDMDLIASMKDPSIAQDILLSLDFSESFTQWLLDCPNILDLYLLIKEILQNNPDISDEDLLELLPALAEGLRAEYDQDCVDWLVKQASLLKE